MQIWEWLLKEDLRLDLSDAGTAVAWFEKLPFFCRSEDASHDKPVAGLEAESVRATWKRNVLCLRSLARKMKRKPTRRPAALSSFPEALDVLHEYIGMLRVEAIPYTEPRVLKITQLAFASYGEPRPVSPGEEGSNPNPNTLGHRVACVRLRTIRPDAFWQAVFRSFVEGGSPVCERCGKDTGGTTKTRRQRYRRLCELCSWKKWRRKQSPEKLRAKWRQDKKKQTKEQLP